MELHEQAFEAGEIRKTKALQVALTAGSILSVIFGAVSGFQWLALPLYGCVLGSLGAFQSRMQVVFEAWYRLPSSIETSPLTVSEFTA